MTSLEKPIVKINMKKILMI